MWGGRGGGVVEWPGCWVLGAGCWVLGAGCRVPGGGVAGVLERPGCRGWPGCRRRGAEWPRCWSDQGAGVTGALGGRGAGVARVLGGQGAGVPE
ncbi:hypothetical protein D3X13_23780 [Streptomyces fradiae]|nr:hypothetical protein D3X13_23780 [Streptomyces fradiae]